VGFSVRPAQYLQKLKIPVLVCYGTKTLVRATIILGRNDKAEKEKFCN